VPRQACRGVKWRNRQVALRGFGLGTAEVRRYTGAGKLECVRLSEGDSFIREVSEEVRRERFSKMLRRYGWIGAPTWSVA
jgi:hypothetical protein